MNKRAIAILGAIFILIVATLGFLIYQRSKSKTNSNTNVNTPIVNDQPDTNTNTTPDQTPDQQTTAKAIKLTDDAVIAPILFYQGNGISYFANTGQLFQTDLQISGTSVLLSNKRELTIGLKPNISKVLWPLAGNSFIAEFNNGGKKTWSFYDSNKAAYVDLPTKIYSLDWMPTGDKIMYVWQDNGKASLFTANPDATGYKKIFDFFDPDDVIDVSPNGQTVLFYRAQNPNSQTNKIISVSPDGKTFKTIVSDGYNQGILWSPDSRKFLFTKKDPSSSLYSLWVADVISGEIRNLGFSTSEQKAVWSKDSQTAYVAVPTKGIVGNGLTEDTIYKINVTSLNKQEYQPGVAIDGEDLFLSSGENVLFLRNAQDNSLYYINL